MAACFKPRIELHKKSGHLKGGRGSLVTLQLEDARSGRKSGERDALIAKLTKPAAAHKIVYTYKLHKDNKISWFSSQKIGI
jgi:hypothetical protein